MNPDSSRCANPLRRGRDGLVALLLLGACLLVFNSNLRTVGAADTYAARYLPLSLWKHGSLLLDPVALHVAQGARPPQKAGQIGEAWWMLRTTDGHLVSMYPPVTPVLVAPLYVPAVLYLNATDWGLQRVERVGRIMEKLAASLLASASVALMFLLLRREAGTRTAVGLALLFGLGTSTWVVSSQALWMHGVGQLLVVGLLWLALLPQRTRWGTFLAGLLCALLACNRQPDALLAAGFAVYCLVRDRGNWRFFLAGGAIPVLATLAYNVGVVGHWVGGYGLAIQGEKVEVSVLGTVRGLAGLLFSPVQGLFVFSPFLLFAPLGFFHRVRNPASRLLASVLAGAVVLQLVFYAAVHWTSGISWGPRFLTDLLPILLWALVPVVTQLSRAMRGVFAALSLLAVTSAAAGAFGYTGAAHAEYLFAHPPQNAAERIAVAEQAAWQLGNSPWKNSPAVFNDLFPGLYGSIDRLSVSSDGLATVEGWALFGDRQPYDVHLLIDGVRVPGGTSQFAYREDVAKFMGNSAAGAWKISFPAKLMTSGRPVFSALVRSHPQAMPWILQAFELPVPAAQPEEPAAATAWQGAIDAVRVYPGRGLDVVGWAARAGQAPPRLELWLDGARAGRVDTFFRRPDVERARGIAMPGGWRVRLPERGLPAGEHTMAVALPSDAPSAAPQYLASKTFTVRAEAAPPPWSQNLPTSGLAKFALWSLQHRQDPEGYWLTDFTDGMQFLDPSPELNVFSTAAITDLLSPVSERLELGGMLDKARHFLSQQIEETGLVRYHGRADRPSHGVMGCRITPDADDTALVWRLAPLANAPLQAGARATLEAFKTPDGLYRTWLATPDRYECIDPGKDPNPPDIGIQIHVLMWLHRADAAAAQKLCQALQARADDASLWVYYRRAPAAVAWRLQDLQSMGCPLKLPRAQLTVQDPDQQRWLKVIEQIHRTEASRDRSQLQANEELLRQLADDRFRRVWQAPVLYFHNDLTATVRRYYWSPELGLALWLRLYAATEAARQPTADSR